MKEHTREESLWKILERERERWCHVLLKEHLKEGQIGNFISI